MFKKPIKKLTYMLINRALKLPCKSYESIESTPYYASATVFFLANPTETPLVINTVDAHSIRF